MSVSRTQSIDGALVYYLRRGGWVAYPRGATAPVFAPSAERFRRHSVHREAVRTNTFGKVSCARSGAACLHRVSRVSHNGTRATPRCCFARSAARGPPTAPPRSAGSTTGSSKEGAERPARSEAGGRAHRVTLGRAWLDSDATATATAATSVF